MLQSCTELCEANLLVVVCVEEPECLSHCGKLLSNLCAKNVHASLELFVIDVLHLISTIMSCRMATS